MSKKIVVHCQYKQGEREEEMHLNGFLHKFSGDYKLELGIKRNLKSDRPNWHYEEYNVINGEDSDVEKFLEDIPTIAKDYDDRKVDDAFTYDTDKFAKVLNAQGYNHSIRKPYEKENKLFVNGVKGIRPEYMGMDYGEVEKQVFSQMIHGEYRHQPDEDF